MDRPSRQLGIGAALLAVFGVGTAVAMAAGVGEWEIEGVSWAHDRADGWAWLLWPVMQLGSTPGALAVALGVGLTLGRRAGIEVFASYAAAYVVANVTKILVERDRPGLAELGVAPRFEVDTFAFPSGHSAQSFAVAVSFALVAGRLGRWRFGLVPVAAATGFARQYFGVHYPGDVLAGAILGTGLALIVDAVAISRAGSEPSTSQ